MKRAAALLAAMTVLGACAPAPIGEPTPEGEAAAADDTQAVDAQALPPAGYGTLRQDDMTVSLRSGPLLIKVVPLDERVIRLAAPDTYSRLHALAESRSAEARPGDGLFLVSFFSYQPDVVFRAEDVQLVSQGRFLRPNAILPVTQGWGQQRLQQQETQMAVYAFDPIDVLLPFSVRYGMEESGAWTRIIPRLEAERNRVMSRATGR